jgi:hypothetical protein
MTEPLALPVDAQKRKDIPIVRGCLDYFPAALAAVAELSRIGNEQHNPGQPMHHARGKSSDHADCIVRHLMDRGVVDTDGVRHSAKVAWRALALLQEELERETGVSLARGAVIAQPTVRPTPPAVTVWAPPGAPSVRLRCGSCGRSWPIDESSSCPECT